MHSKTNPGRRDAAAEPGAAAQSAAERETVQSVIGPGLRVEGSIDSGGSVRVEGSVAGDVTARTLMVGNSGVVEGQIAAAFTQIEGTVRGSVEGDTVILGKTARVGGDIAYRSLSVDPGALFDGQVRPLKSDEETETEDQQKPDSATG